MSALPRGVCPPGGQNNLLIVVDSCLIRPAFALTLSCNAQHRKKRRKKASGANRERLLWERPICSLAHDDLSRSSMENLFNQHFDGNRQSVWLNEVLIWGVLTFCHFCYMELFVITSHTDQPSSDAYSAWVGSVCGKHVVTLAKHWSPWQRIAVVR